MGKFMEVAVKSRNIERVYHFTRVENLDSILENGLIPRSELDRHRHQYQHNDEERHDFCRNANCLSIGFPNYKMFWPLRCDNGGDWAVIVYKADILWEFDCAFCIENAAKATVSEIPIDSRKGPLAFHRLFFENPSKPSRVAMGLPSYYPTNPQAEVLVFGVIASRYIISVYVDNNRILQLYQKKWPWFNFELKTSYFKGRKDWNHWK
ncbi:TPA: DUF4433 domain-containing protein [Vibrio parahaemolyticus]|nr:DUF4433 domain-containing protein [Vibrio parahaemolyticus]EJG0732083.1 DUF4433 domain-containing protein [Vibrio parahaemolyticus]EJG0787480.1 DUF4433 domain-containing protein [Vibrio parahaemolyticus]HCH0948453.1 DUF4433 domain-containing protein [Vibrio parahaemolyticus]